MIESLLQKGQRGRASSTCQLSESPNRGIIWKRHSSEPLNETHMATSRKDAVLWTESCVRCLSGASEIARLSRGKRARAFRSKESTFSLSLSFSGVDTRARKDRLLLLLLRLLLPQTRSLAGRFLEGKKPAHARARKRAISGKPCFPQKNRVIRVYLFAHDSESFLKKSSQTAFSKNPLPRPRSERFESESEMMRSLALTLSLSLSLSRSRALSRSLSLSLAHTELSPIFPRKEKKTRGDAQSVVREVQAAKYFLHSFRKETREFLHSFGKKRRRICPTPSKRDTRALSRERVRESERERRPHTTVRNARDFHPLSPPTATCCALSRSMPRPLSRPTTVPQKKKTPL